jgi:hypothetical protein
MCWQSYYGVWMWFYFYGLQLHIHFFFLSFLCLLSLTLCWFSTPDDQAQHFEGQNSRHYKPSNHRELFTCWSSVTSQKIWFKGYHIIAVIMFALGDTDGCRSVLESWLQACYTHHVFIMWGRELIMKVHNLNFRKPVLFTIQYYNNAPHAVLDYPVIRSFIVILDH